MAFHDVRLPEHIERGAQGGPRFKTTVLTLSSGFEKRNIDWANTRAEFDISYGMLHKDESFVGEDNEDHTFTTVLDFFYARQGRAHSFRFKDWSDYTIGDDATDTPQTIGTGDGMETDFQVFKRYTSGATTYDRTITKLVSGTVRVFLDGVEQMAGYTVDLLTGIVSFAVAPAGAVVVAVICEFDVPVRFDTDAFDITLATFQAGAIPSLNLVEVRGE